MYSRAGGTAAGPSGGWKAGRPAKDGGIGGGVGMDAGPTVETEATDGEVGGSANGLVEYGV